MPTSSDCQMLSNPEIATHNSNTNAYQWSRLILTIQQVCTQLTEPEGWDWRTNTFQSNVSSEIWSFSSFFESAHIWCTFVFVLPGFVFLSFADILSNVHSVLYFYHSDCSMLGIDVMDLRKLKWFICVVFLRFFSLAELCKLVAEFIAVCIAIHKCSPSRPMTIFSHFNYELKEKTVADLKLLFPMSKYPRAVSRT